MLVPAALATFVFRVVEQVRMKAHITHPILTMEGLFIHLMP